MGKRKLAKEVNKGTHVQKILLVKAGQKGKRKFVTVEDYNAGRY